RHSTPGMNVKLDERNNLCYVSAACPGPDRSQNPGTLSSLATEGVLISMKQKAAQPARETLDVMTRVEQQRKEFSKSELQIAELLLKDPHAFARLNVKEIAAKVEVS